MALVTAESFGRVGWALLPLAGRYVCHLNKLVLVPKTSKQEEIVEVTSFWLPVCNGK